VEIVRRITPETNSPTTGQASRKANRGISTQAVFLLAFSQSKISSSIIDSCAGALYS